MELVSQNETIPIYTIKTENFSFSKICTLLEQYNFESFKEHINNNSQVSENTFYYCNRKINIEELNELKDAIARNDNLKIKISAGNLESVDLFFYDNNYGFDVKDLIGRFNQMISSYGYCNYMYKYSNKFHININLDTVLKLVDRNGDIKFIIKHNKVETSNNIIIKAKYCSQKGHYFHMLTYKHMFEDWRCFSSENKYNQENNYQFIKEKIKKSMIDQQKEKKIEYRKKELVLPNKASKKSKIYIFNLERKSPSSVHSNNSYSDVNLDDDEDGVDIENHDIDKKSYDYDYPTIPKASTSWYSAVESESQPQKIEKETKDASTQVTLDKTITTIRSNEHICILKNLQINTDYCAHAESLQVLKIEYSDIPADEKKTGDLDNSMTISTQRQSIQAFNIVKTGSNEFLAKEIKIIYNALK